jgi:hypothetical protein
LAPWKEKQEAWLGDKLVATLTKSAGLQATAETVRTSLRIG